VLSKQEEYVSKDKVSTRSLQRAKRSGGPDAWIFRWYEDQPNGRKRYRKTVVGTVIQFPTETAARKAADALRIDINLQTRMQAAVRRRSISSSNTSG
jgi:integrase